MKEIFIFSLLVSTAVSARGGADDKLKILHKWRAVDFDFPSPAARDASIRKGAFTPGNPIPIDVDVWEKGGKKKMFLTIPRFLDGVPASLVTVSHRSDNESPLLAPYPDWSWHTEGKCSGVTSAFRMQVDKCDRLWVIDSGMVDLFKYPRRRLCQPQVLAFDLKNDALAGKHQFPDSVLTEGSVLATIAVDVRDRCDQTFVYIADVTGFSILVVDTSRGKSWRVQSNSMFPYPPYGLFKTNGVEFDLMDGVLGMALGPVEKGDRTLYYHPFASVRESWVATSVLKNESLYSTGFNAAPRRFFTSDEARASQSAPEAFDKHGNLFFGIIARNSLACWNSKTPYTESNINELVKDDQNLQFTTGLKIRENKDGEEELYLMTDRFHLAMVGKMNANEFNFRLIKARVKDLVEGTACQNQRRPDKPVVFPKPSYRPSNGYLG